MLEALEGFWLAAFLRRSTIAYPLVNATHILSLGALVTSAVLMDLRVLGLGRRLGMAEVIGHLRVVAVIALAGALTTGVLLFSVRPQHYADNRVFLAKMALLSLALANAALFTILERHRYPQTLVTRAMALASIGLWLAVLLAGRVVAFFE